VTGTPGATHAARQIIVAPTRIVFDKGQRAATVYVSNKGNEPATLRISVVNKRMLDTGLIVDVDTPQPDERFLKDMIRFSPRRIVVEPGSSQTVRLLLRKPTSPPLPPGEYRAHLVLRSTPPPPTQTSTSVPNTKEITVAAMAIIETSIPLIYRKGSLAASARFSSSDARLETPSGGAPMLTVRLEREGERSVYGDIEVTHVGSDGSVYQLAYLGGVAVYHPTPSRRFRMSLRVPEGVRLNAGQLDVSFHERNQKADAVTSKMTIPLD
jgi:P pilus assembly chaperone PapD